MRKRRRWLQILILITALLLVAIPVTAQEPADETPATVVETGEVLTEDLVLLNGLAHIEEGATVKGEVAMMTGELLIEGHVTGDVVAFGGTVTLGPTAHIEGDVIAFGELDQHPDAFVGGRITRATDGEGAEDAIGRALGAVPGGEWLADQVQEPQMRGPQWLANRAGMLILALLATWAIVTVLPQNVEHVTEIMTHSALLSIGTGLLALVVVTLLAIFMSLICIGLPVALVLGLGLIVAVALGWASTSSLLGDYLGDLLNLPVGNAALRAVLGGLIITILGLAPWFGFFLATAIICWSIGAVLLTRFGSRPDSTWTADIGRKLTGNHHDSEMRPSSSEAPPALTEPAPTSPRRETHKLSSDSLGDIATDDATL